MPLLRAGYLRAVKCLLVRDRSFCTMRVRLRLVLCVEVQVFNLDYSIPKYMSLELVLQLSGYEGLARMAELELDGTEFPSTSGGRSGTAYARLP